MNLKPATQELLDFVKAHDGRCTTEEAREGLGCEKIASITGRVNSLVKNELAYREKVDEGGEKPVTYIQLTEAGMNYEPSEEE